MVVALKPIYDAVGIKRVVVSTYQAVSGSGQGGIAALDAQARQWAAGEPVEPQFYPHQIAFNVLPHIDSFLPSGSTKEEQKMVDETIKIFADPEPQGDRHLRARAGVRGAQRGRQRADPRRSSRPARLASCSPAPPASSSSTTRPSCATRCRSTPRARTRCTSAASARTSRWQNGLDLWVVSDNLRKGAALNAVQIAEELVRRGLL